MILCVKYVYVIKTKIFTALQYKYFCLRKKKNQYLNAYIGSWEDSYPRRCYAFIGRIYWWHTSIHEMFYKNPIDFETNRELYKRHI